MSVPRKKIPDPRLPIQADSQTLRFFLRVFVWYVKGRGVSKNIVCVLYNYWLIPF